MRRRFLAAILLLVMGAAPVRAQAPNFIPGDPASGDVPPSWSGWHNLYTPANRAKWVVVNYDAGTDTTVSFGWTMDCFYFFTEGGACSVGAKVTAAGLATGADIDTSLVELPADVQQAVICEFWTGVQIKGATSPGTLFGRVIGRTR